MSSLVEKLGKNWLVKKNTNWSVYRG